MIFNTETNPGGLSAAQPSSPFPSAPPVTPGAANYREGQTATSPDGKRRVVFRSGMWVKDTSYLPPQPRATTTNSDMRALDEANANAAAGRETTSQYLQAAQALDDLGGTGPWKEALMSAGAPGSGETTPSRGWLGDALGAVGGVLSAVGGAAARPFFSEKKLEARDRLRTIAANGVLSRSGQLKGPASDRDVAFLRSGGLDLSKTTGENKRVLMDGIRQGGLAQTRALVTSRWIADNGSLVAKNRGGLTYQEALQQAEARYADDFARRQAARRQAPSAPPSVKGSRTLTIDLDGRVIR